MQSIPLPEFVIPLWIAAVILIVVCGAILIRGNRGGNVSAIEAALTPFAMPFGIAGFLALVISGIGSLLLTVGKEPAVPVALAITILIMVGAWLASRGGEEAHPHSH